MRIPQSTGGSYRLPDPGQYQAVCVDFVDLGIRPNPFEQGETQHQCRIVFELNASYTDGDGVVRNMIHSEFMTAVIHERSNLGKLLLNWMGRALGPQDYDPDGTWNSEKCIGRQAWLSIVHTPKQSGGFKAVATVNPPLPNQNFQPSGQYTRVRDRESQQQEAGSFDFGANVPDTTAPLGQPQSPQSPVEPRSPSGGIQGPPGSQSAPQAPVASPQAPQDPHPDIDWGQPGTTTDTSAPQEVKSNPIKEDEAW